ncbi:maleylpyruvate isomerase family mycothiol-dependent enzyme [Streptosporangiaceae bacterium NEAU-GS5]|nr:maleylpyruvate isomerase family mycothiol-dependent enzyme [Streptosporangiaceae bacterium NEAU-GS5]
MIDRDMIWKAVDTERLALADLLERLPDDEWARPSLCDGWTARDVAAHLTQQQVGFGAALAMLIRAHGDVGRGIRDAARRRAAAWSTGQIIAAIRGMVGSRRHNAGVTCRETLIDILVHTQDIVIPLGRDHAMPTRAAVVAADRLWSMRWPPPLPGRRRMTGFRLVATDADWAIGAGPEVHAPISAIVLLTAGRLTALSDLYGPGAPELTARLSSQGTRVR